jgi:aryl-alcohol dehydrogenase-like predicted oxidoreductase
MQLLLGTANFSKKYRLSSEEPFCAQQLLVTAFENGIDCLDVSDAYDGAAASDTGAEHHIVQRVG